MPSNHAGRSTRWLRNVPIPARGDKRVFAVLAGAFQGNADREAWCNARQPLVYYGTETSWVLDYNGGAPMESISTDNVYIEIPDCGAGDHLIVSASFTHARGDALLGRYGLLAQEDVGGADEFVFIPGSTFNDNIAGNTTVAAMRIIATCKVSRAGDVRIGFWGSTNSVVGVTLGSIVFVVTRVPNRRALDPALLPMEGWWRSYALGDGVTIATPWVGMASTGGSGSRDLTEGTNFPSAGIAQPRQLGSDNFWVRTPVEFDGVNDIVSGAACSNFMTTTTGSGHCLVRIDAVDNNNSDADNNTTVWSDSNSGNVSLFVRENGTARYAGFRINNGSDKVVTMAEGSFTLDQYEFLQWRATGKKIQIRINGGDWTTADGGVISSLASNLRLGLAPNGTLFTSMRVADIGFSKKVLTTNECDGVLEYIRATHHVEPRAETATDPDVIDPADENQTLWVRAPFVNSPWAGETSIGFSGDYSLSEATNPPTPTSGTDLLNGYAVAVFNGTSNRLLTSCTLASLVTRAFSFILLFRPGLTLADCCLLADVNDKLRLELDASSEGVRLMIDDGSAANTSYVDVASTTATTPANGGWCLVRGKWDGTNMYLARGRQAFAAGVASGAPSNLTGALRIGCNAAGSGGFFGGRMAELMWAADDWSESDFEERIEYIEARYDIGAV